MDKPEELLIQGDYSSQEAKILSLALYVCSEGEFGYERRRNRRLSKKRRRRPRRVLQPADGQFESFDDGDWDDFVDEEWQDEWSDSEQEEDESYEQDGD